MPFDVASIPNAFDTRHGMPRPNWEAISDSIERQASEQNRDDAWKNDAWTQAARQWLDKLRLSLLIEYVVLESPEFYLLAAARDSTKDTLLRWCQYYQRSILATLDDVGNNAGYGKQVILAFHDHDTFYSYICDFYPEEGEFGTAGGIFLDTGYGHVALWTQGKYDLERTIVHELTHAMLRHLPLPLWLNEGVTHFVEDIAVGSKNFFMTSDLAQRHREYWNETTINAFWSGESFYFPDDGQELSYSLADVLFHNLKSEFPNKMLDFLKLASASDAGNQALHETCGVGLSDRVAQFLGPGPWQPQSDYGELP